MSLDFYLSATRRVDVYSGGITHNLVRMAAAAGVYKVLWRPEECGITTASQMIPALENGLKKLTDNPQYYRLFDPSNDWGTWGGLVQFVRDTLRACQENPDATVEVSR